MLEWNLPPLRFSRVGHAGRLPELAAAGALRERARHQPGQRARSAAKAASFGGQIDLRFTVLSALDMTLSLSAAPCAPSHGVPSRSEGMMSLRVLK